MKYIIILLMLVCYSANAQSVYNASDDKWIGPALDSTILTTKTMISWELYITNLSLTDTLVFITDRDTDSSYLFPNQAVHFNNIYAKKIYRRAYSGDSVYSQLRGN